MVFSVLLLALPRLLRIGGLALHYWTTTYAFRGGASNGVATCGAFYVYVGNTSSVTHWSFGAALLNYICFSRWCFK